MKNQPPSPLFKKNINKNVGDIGNNKQLMMFCYPMREGVQATSIRNCHHTLVKYRVSKDFELDLKNKYMVLIYDVTETES